jgi:hypothetical protein
MVDRLLAAAIFDQLDGRMGFGPAALADGTVEGDAIQPGVKGRGPPKRVELQERLHERILHDVERIVGRADDVDDRVIQPVLILGD